MAAVKKIEGGTSTETSGNRKNPFCRLGTASQFSRESMRTRSLLSGIFIETMANSNTAPINSFRPNISTGRTVAKRIVRRPGRHPGHISGSNVPAFINSILYGSTTMTPYSGSSGPLKICSSIGIQNACRSASSVVRWALP